MSRRGVSNHAKKPPDLAQAQGLWGDEADGVDIVTLVALVNHALQVRMVAAFEGARRQNLWPRTFGWPGEGGRQRWRSPVSFGFSPEPPTAPATNSRSPVSSTDNPKGESP